METSSNQLTTHKNLTPTVKKHINCAYKKPTALHNEKEFKKILSNIANSKFIIDTGCGTGLSTEYLAELNPKYHILGLDKSTNRLSKASSSSKNLSFHRIDLIDFFLLADKNNLKSEITYFLYPNPWPKSEHLKRRWHAHPIFPKILNCSKQIVLRTDWKIYLDEFKDALKIHEYELQKSEQLSLNQSDLNNGSLDQGISRFEQKFIKQKRNLYELIANE